MKPRKLYFLQRDSALFIILRVFIVVTLVFCVLVFIDIIPRFHRYLFSAVFAYQALIVLFLFWNDRRLRYSVQYSKAKIWINLGSRMKEMPFVYQELKSFERTNNRFVLHRKDASAYEINTENIEARSIDKLVDILTSHGVENFSRLAG